MEWISTKDKQPDDGQNVICAAKMDGETWWFGCCKYMGFFPWVKFDNPNPVEFWMPLPEAPHPKTVMVELLVEDAEYFLTLTPPSKVLQGRYEVASNNFFDAVKKAIK